MPRRRVVLAVLAGAATTALAFRLYARVDWPWFVLGGIGLVPWMAALDGTRTLGGAAAAGVAMGVAFSIGVFSWFAGAMAHYAGAPWGVGLAALVALTPVLQPQFVGFAIVRRCAQRLGAGFWTTALAGACAYVGSEWLCPKLFADTIGHGVFASPLLRQAADLAGAPGLTFALVVVNTCVLRLLRREQGAWRAAVGAAVLVSGLAVYGAVRIRQLDTEIGAAPITAGIVQANVSGYEGLRDRLGTYEAVRSILDAHFALSEGAVARGPLDLLIWPETVYPTTFGAPKSPEGAAFDQEIDTFVSRTRVPLVFGSYDAGDGAEFNAAMFLAQAADGRLGLDAYRKATLFPLTERVPALLDTALVRRWLPWLGTWAAGPGPTVVDLPLADGRTLRVAPLICYDAVDPRLAIAAVRRGADVIVTLSNDSWFARGAGPRLHLVVSAFRSLETRRPQLRATNTGISAVISPTGELLAAAGVHERTALVARVTPVRGVRTLVLRWGDWFGPAALIGGAALLGLAAARRRSAA